MVRVRGSPVSTREEHPAVRQCRLPRSLPRRPLYLLPHLQRFPHQCDPPAWLPSVTAAAVAEAIVRFFESAGLDLERAIAADTLNQFGLDSVAYATWERCQSTGDPDSCNSTVPVWRVGDSKDSSSLGGRWWGPVSPDDYARFPAGDDYSGYMEYLALPPNNVYDYKAVMVVEMRYIVEWHIVNNQDWFGPEYGPYSGSSANGNGIEFRIPGGVGNSRTGFIVLPLDRGWIPGKSKLNGW